MLLHEAFLGFLELIVARDSAATSCESTILATAHEAATEIVEPVDQPVSEVVKFEFLPLL